MTDLKNVCITRVPTLPDSLVQSVDFVFCHGCALSTVRIRGLPPLDTRLKKTLFVKGGT